MATENHIPRRLAALAAALLVSLVAVDAASAYDWPLKPFGRQHPVRAYFNDPRIGEHSETFHFGIDISAPDGTPVYAVDAGVVYLTSGRVVAVVGQRVFGYWHVVPAVRAGQHVARHQLLGRIEKGWGHVHFSEKPRVGAEYVNPLRPGGLAPFRDRRPPAIDSLELDQQGRALQSADLESARGRVDLVVEAHDLPALEIPDPLWTGTPVTPALIRWRLVGGGRSRPWRTAVDFRRLKLPPSRFHQVYAPGTEQNHPNQPGRFRFYLARRLDLSRFAPGAYRVDVRVLDGGGNAASASIRFRVGAASALGRP
jgi:hypothetical protein